ncbi:MAG: T9SS type A sorting domain-containing protein [Calditrichae bacterium]|nr:T9SS type A sorting domain-containing protein [Calditrichota bacterium]MCB9057880.1 T9SS type A sorting domain-containing protein [Calditrichia bacterium]
MLIRNKPILAFVFFVILSVQLSAQTKQWRVIWNMNNESDMDKYLLYRGETANPTTLAATLNHPDTVYTDKNIEKGVLYYYRLKAQDLTGNQSSFSDQVSAAIPKIDFSSIQNKVISAGQTFSFDLDNFVNDPDDNDASLHWEVLAGSVLNVNFNQSDNSVSVTAPASWTTSDILKFTVTDPDSFFDVVNLNFYSDSSDIPPDPGIKINAYPIPYREDVHGNTGIIFDNLPEQSTLVIYNFLGEPVFKEADLSGTYTWLVVNDSGKKVGSGLYLYRIKSKNKTISGKLVVVR